jgi:hypothetical protein
MRQIHVHAESNANYRDDKPVRNLRSHRIYRLGYCDGFCVAAITKGVTCHGDPRSIMPEPLNCRRDCLARKFAHNYVNNYED